MNRIESLFKSGKKNILSIYFTAGYPNVNDTMGILRSLEKAGVDMVEIGMPFSDPMADGPIIQESSQTALKNGMTLNLLFDQLKDIRKEVHIPLLLMGYLNPVLNMGVESFCKKASEVGIDGIILPDLPLDEYISKYKMLFEKYHLSNIFLVTPQTSEERIREIDNHGSGFIYLVSTYSITGANKNLTGSEEYFKRLQTMNLRNPKMIGFGISDKENFDYACKFADGAIIGTAFIKSLKNNEYQREIPDFVSKIKTI